MQLRNSPDGIILQIFHFIKKLKLKYTNNPENSNYANSNHLTHWRNMQIVFVLLSALLVLIENVHAENSEFSSVTKNIINQIAISDTKESRAYCGRFVSADGSTDTKCRYLTMVKNADKNIIAGFYEGFTAPRRDIGATTYFIKNNSGDDYTAYFDSNFDQNPHQIDLAYSENKNIKIEFNNKGLPKILNITLAKWNFQNFSGYSLVTITYDEDQVSLTGTAFETNSETGTTDKTPIHEIYKIVL